MRLRIEGADSSVAVAGGRIVEDRGRFDVTLRIPDGQIRPGLINAHEHLHRNHYPALGAPPYANSYEWGRDIHERQREEIARARAVPRRRALLVGAWKNLLAGVTTVVHHDAWEPSFARRFPIGVARVRSGHSLRLEPELGADPGSPLCIHLAEGVDDASADEVRELDELGLLNERLIAVHVVGADEDGVRRLRAAGAAVAWCPSSNIFLFGRTVPPALLEPGLDVLLGSDSLLTGAGSLLDELRLARGLGLLDDARLASAVGETAARRLGLPAPSLEPGSVADLVVLRNPLLQATLKDVALVLVGGEVRVADPGLGPELDRLGMVPALVGQGALARRVACPGPAELRAAEAGLRAALGRRPAIEPEPPAPGRAPAQRSVPGTRARSSTQARRR